MSGVARELIDLLWREHPDAPRGGARGPRTKVSTSELVRVAAELADVEGLAAVTARRAAAAAGISTMALYTHVGSREDLLVLMADAAYAAMPKPRYRSRAWRQRVRQVAQANLVLHVEHAWLLEVTDQRVAFGPGTIGKYDHELRAFDSMGLDDVDRDAALSFVLDFARSAAQARRPDPHAADMAQVWQSWYQRLDGYLGARYPLAQRVGAAAGEAMNAAYSPEHAWQFGLARVLDALAALDTTSVVDRADLRHHDTT